MSTKDLIWIYNENTNMPECFEIIGKKNEKFLVSTDRGNIIVSNKTHVFGFSELEAHRNFHKKIMKDIDQINEDLKL